MSEAQIFLQFADRKGFDPIKNIKSDIARMKLIGNTRDDAFFKMSDCIRRRREFLSEVKQEKSK